MNNYHDTNRHISASLHAAYGCARSLQNIIAAKMCEKPRNASWRAAGEIVLELQEQLDNVRQIVHPEGETWSPSARLDAAMNREQQHHSYGMAQPRD